MFEIKCAQQRSVTLCNYAMATREFAKAFRDFSTPLIILAALLVPLLL